MVFLACHDGGNSFVFWVYFGWNDFHVEQLRFTPSQVHPSSWRHQRPYGTVHYYYWQALMRVLKSQLLVYTYTHFSAIIEPFVNFLKISNFGYLCWQRKICLIFSSDGKQGWRSGEAIASHQCGPGSIPARCHMWVDFVVDSLHASRIFLQFLWFSSL